MLIRRTKNLFKVNKEEVVEDSAHWEKAYFIRPSFLYLLNEFPDGELYGIEVGAGRGVNAGKMLKVCDRLKLVMVDIEDSLGVREVEKLYGDRALFMNLSSLDAAEAFDDETFDYVYIDARHQYPDPKNDMKAWFPKVKTGGVLAGHDWWFTGVKQSVWEFLKENEPTTYPLTTVHPFYDANIKFYNISMSDWWIKKLNEEERGKIAYNRNFFREENF